MLEANVTPDSHVFLGEDKKLRLTIYTDHTRTEILDTSAMALLWQLKKFDHSSAPLLEKSTYMSPVGITHDGTFNSDPDQNTQQVVVDLDAADTYTTAGSPTFALRQRNYRHALKRMDAGSETVLARGNFYFGQAATR